MVGLDWSKKAREIKLRWGVFSSSSGMLSVWC